MLSPDRFRRHTDRHGRSRRVADARPPRRRFALRLQFSLRFLLLAFTVFAVGFPIWYRWPYQEVEKVVSEYERITTWRRAWGGVRVKHGTERTKYLGNRMLLVKTFRNGVEHGPCQWIVGDHPYFVGQMRNGTQDGLWTYSNRRADGVYVVFRVEFEQGAADGEAVLQHEDGKVDHLTFWRAN